jgi:hypothetical protein
MLGPEYSPRSGGDRTMWRVIGAVLLGLTAQACSMTKGPDPEQEMFAALFDVPRGSCRELRAQLQTEIEGIKAARKKARDDMLADADAPSKDAKAPRPSRKDDPLAPLREWSKRSEAAEKLNTALKERHCRTVDIETATR